MLRTNVEKLVKISVMGEISSPVFWRSAYRISAEGKPMVLQALEESPTTFASATRLSDGWLTTWSQA